MQVPQRAAHGQAGGDAPLAKHPGGAHEAPLRVAHLGHPPARPLNSAPLLVDVRSKVSAQGIAT